MTTGIDYADKIAKLLNKAASTDAEAEAEALRDRAYDMMGKYQIDRAVIEAKRRADGGKITEKIVEKPINITGIFRHGLATLAFSVTQALGDVHAYEYKNWHTKVTQQNGKVRLAESVLFMVVGYESDVDSAIMLITALQMQAASDMTRWWNDDPYGEHANMSRGLAFRSKRSFIKAFGSGAGQKIRLSVIRAKATLATGSGAELVIRDKTKQVDDYVDKLGLRSTKNRLQDGVDDARQSGYAAGQRANTGDNALGKTTRRRLT